MIKIEKTTCCGCGACAAACPQKCIEMREDDEGFMYPHIDKSRCISCKSCTRVCPSLTGDGKKSQGKTDKSIVLGGFHKNKEVLKKSSSGGAFTLLANEMIRRGGKVYGCVLDENLMGVHVGVYDYQGLERLRGAKYVQSVMGESFHDIYKDLEEGRAVLFTGTPCECASLNQFLGKSYDNLYVCDFICHGVPSRGVFREWIKYQGNKYQDKIENILFRNKDFGWNSRGTRLQKGMKIVFTKNVKQNILALFDPYMNGFLEDLYLRPSCYSCTFKGTRIYSDITIADFWGVKKVNRAIYNKEGTSLVILHTDKGKKLFELTEGEFEYQLCSGEKALLFNKSYFESAKPHLEREHFFADYHKNGIEYVIKKYLTLPSCIKYRLMRKKQ